MSLLWDSSRVAWNSIAMMSVAEGSVIVPAGGANVGTVEVMA